MELYPQPFAVLLARILAERASTGMIFDLPESGWWKGDPSVDLAVTFHEDRAANAVGPAAGPQSQLAQNLVLSWLAGSRILELKTIQINDQLKLPRPCIDAETIGYNIEWSQELRLEVSLREYVSGWYLVQILKSLDLVGPSSQHDTLFDFSVGYDLDGIKSDPVAKWLDTLQDAGPLIDALRDSLPAELRAVADVEVPTRLSNCVTLSTFHGCPADEIERIVEHLYDRHQVHVIVKLNPTLLGYERVREMVRGQLGYEQLELDRANFDADLQWDHCLEMFERLARKAASVGRTLGAKFTNTLVVRNHRNFFPKEEKTMYLSGQPLHVVSTVLCHEFVQATQGRHGPPSFSAGIDAGNFHESVACGMIPVTTCTDLLRPGGYKRLPKYLTALETRMKKLGAKNIDEYILAVAGEPLDGNAETIWAAARKNLAAYAAQLPDDVRYHQAKNQKPPRKIGSTLELFDCVSCNKCVPVCPNDANFEVHTPKVSLETWTLRVEDDQVKQEAASFDVQKERQWATYADFCNECGNCDVFCPEDGGPYKLKPRFFGTRETFDEVAPQDAVLVGAEGITARIDGTLYELSFRDGRALFSDGVLEVELDADHRVVSTTLLEAVDGHEMPLWRYHAMRLLRTAALATVNPVSVLHLPLGT